jgi:hypothetical protein
LIGFSCIQEEDIQTSIDQEISPEIQKVKSWFEENKVLLQPKPGSANAREFSYDLILPFFEKEPDWEDFYSYQFPDGRRVFEVHLKNLTGIMPTAFMEKYGSQADDLTEESLLFIENPLVADGFVPVVVRYFSEVQKSEGMTYHQIPLGWTGMIDLFTYDERHLRSIKVQDGQLISHIRYQTEEPKVSSRSVSSLIVCSGYWVEFPFYGMNGVPGVVSQKSVYVYECTSFNNGGGGGSFIPVNPPSGPPTGGGTPTNPPPPTGNPGEDDESNNFCRDNLCIPFPEERDQIIKDPSFEGTNADCIFEKLKSINGFNQVSGRFDGVTSELDVIFKIGATQNPNATGQTQWMGSTSRPIEITLNQNRLGSSALEVARTILHEMIHAEIYGAIKTNIPTTEDLSFRDTFEEYTRRFSGNDAIHHNLMADKFVKYMADVLQQIHPQLGGSAYADFMNYPGGYPNGVPREFYEALAWTGLKDANVLAYQALSPTKKAEITEHLRKAETGRKSCN